MSRRDEPTVHCCRAGAVRWPAPCLYHPDAVAPAMATPPTGTPGPGVGSAAATRPPVPGDASSAARGDASRVDAWRNAPEPVNIACCPVHGLHGQRDECFECGGPVDQLPYVRADLGRLLPIERETRGGGRLTLSHTSRTSDRCATCDGPAPIGLRYRTTLEGASCGGCQGTGEVEERHDFGAVEMLGCPDCEATGRAPCPTLETGICATCLSEGLAILFGRRHVQGGGALTDLSFGGRQTVDEPPA